MTITDVTVSVFQIGNVTPLLTMVERDTTPHADAALRERWRPRPSAAGANWWRTMAAADEEPLHVLHVTTDTGIEGVCTVGDVRYRVMTERELAQLRALVVGERIDTAAARRRLDSRLHAATRYMFTRPGWYGAFDNCLWDIAGKAADKPVCELLGRARPSCPAYYNSGGGSKADAVADTMRALELGFSAVKDHFADEAEVNLQWFRAVREAAGDGVTLMHDAAGCNYSYQQAVRVGEALGELGYLWFEEPLPDRGQRQLQRLCRELEIAVLGPETLMHDRELCAEWLLTDTVDTLRGNARHGTTALLELAELASERGTTVELNGPGGLFGLVHAHLCCAIDNTRFYEYFPGGTRDRAGIEIGLTNPPVPVAGAITPPPGPGWGAEWDWPYFERKRLATL